MPRISRRSIAVGAASLSLLFVAGARVSAQQAGKKSHRLLLHIDVEDTFTMNHVLEHLENSSNVINKIFESCNRLGIKRVVFTVPGHKGYKSDATHETFINMDYLKKTGVTENKYYRLSTNKYFPVNSEAFSRYFTHNELRLVFDKRQ